MTTLRVLQIEDNVGDARLLAAIVAELPQSPLSLTNCTTLAAGIEQLQQHEFDAVLLDLHLPDSAGLGTLRKLLQLKPHCPAILILSGLADEELAIQAVDMGAQDYLPKGSLDGEAIVRAIRYAISRHHADAEIRQLNQELERYCYSMSNHLRAPLRRIEGFSHALLQEQDEFNPETRAIVERIANACEEMREVVDGLNNLTLMARREIYRSSTDVSALARSLGQVLADEHPQRTVTLQVQPNMQASADVKLVRLLLEHLLRNAWKFTRPQPHPLISVTATAGHETVFCVRDNGVGFDMAYVDQLFAPFQHLHPISEFEGSGVGLATVQRIVALHGGRIWAEGKVNDGAAFYFTLAPPPIVDSPSTTLASKNPL